MTGWAGPSQAPCGVGRLVSSTGLGWAGAQGKGDVRVVRSWEEGGHSPESCVVLDKGDNFGNVFLYSTV